MTRTRIPGVSPRGFDSSTKPARSRDRISATLSHLAGYLRREVCTHCMGEGEVEVEVEVEI
jgi:hypothetical protein